MQDVEPVGSVVLICHQSEFSVSLQDGGGVWSRAGECCKEGAGLGETTRGMVLSRLACYTALAILAIVLLVAPSPASGSQGVPAMQFRKGSTEVQDLHSFQMLNSVRVSVWTLRGRMHN